MSEVDNKSGISIDFNSAMLDEKFKSEALQRKLTKLLSDRELQNYIEEKLLKPCNEAVNALVPGLAKDFMRDTVKEANVWLNIRINVMYNSVKQAFIAWLSEGKNIDDELEKILDVEFCKYVTDIVCDTILCMVERSEELAAEIPDEDENFESFGKSKPEKKYLN